ncbi:hypothetical protein [Pseudomonas eucalypticola]|uniref:XRE family transcriptional regulator n=1 Tax=Pseudomonas eucalypticola TaxID=2599595 RepID=A0A7D5D810_9PSED|nr:hypothetical protein [Pseudomonas eucalypticola]QKZ04141.1 hypothetical protein HWQ56_10240 [Pseudomonas eucalypticola]
MYSSNLAIATRNSGAVNVAARTALVVFGLFMGTGSNATPLNYDRSAAYAKPKADRLIQTAESSSFKYAGVDVRSPVQHLENVKNILALPVSETAGLFGVTRQSIYKWLAGSSMPEQEKLERLSELSRIADLFNEASVSRPGDLLRMKAFEGKSVLDLFKDGADYSACLSMLIAESKAMDVAYDSSGISKLQQKRTDDWKATISIPFSDDV